MLSLMLLLAAAPKAQAPAPRAAAELPAEKWLLSWVDEAAKPGFMKSFHAQFPGSPHRAASERFELAARCYQASRAPPKKLEPVLAELRARLAKGRDTCIAAPKAACGGLPEAPLPQRSRAAAALGCLRDATSIEALGKAAHGSDEGLAKAAIDALGYFGNRVRHEGFLVFGGQYRAVAFPPAHDVRATRALLEVWEASPARRSWVLNALESHALPEVEPLVQAALAVQTPAAGDALLAERTLAGAALSLVRDQRCGRCAGWVAPLTEHAEPWTRISAVETLGDLPDRASVIALIARLTDLEDGVREEAQGGLLKLSGVRPPLGASKVSREDGALLQEGWKKRWGEKAQGYDPALAVPARAWEPGIY